MTRIINTDKPPVGRSSTGAVEDSPGGEGSHIAFALPGGDRVAARADGAGEGPKIALAQPASGRQRVGRSTSGSSHSAEASSPPSPSHLPAVVAHAPPPASSSRVGRSTSGAVTSTSQGSPEQLPGVIALAPSHAPGGRTGRSTSGSVMTGGVGGPLLPPPQIAFAPRDRRNRRVGKSTSAAAGWASAADSGARGRVMSRTVRFVVVDNGAGLSRDLQVLEAEFMRAGWNTMRAHPQEPESGAPLASVNVHLEILAPHLMSSARRNVVVPNPEWWHPQWNGALSHPNTTVWSKTADAARVFRSLGCRVSEVGFRAQDRRDTSVGRERRFLHVAGASPHKGTADLIAAWEPGWPQLTVVASVPGYVSRPNVEVLQRMPDDELRALQNRCLFHVYPSRYEGFGHAVWEALSCGAVVLAPTGAPFDEWPDCVARIDAEDGPPSGVNDLVRMRYVTRDGLGRAVDGVLRMSPDEVASRGAAGRLAFEAGTDRFRERVAEELREMLLDLSDLPPVTYAGRVDCVIGYGEAARHQIWSLRRRRGLRMKVVDAGSLGSPGDDEFVRTAREDNSGGAPSVATIVHLNPPAAVGILAQMPELPRPRVLVSVWETTCLAPSWVQTCNSFDQVWCATEWQAGVYRDSGVDASRVRVVPFAVDPALFPVDGPRAERPAGASYVFGSVFEWTERKAPEVLLRAFLRAFLGRRDVALVLKTSDGTGGRCDVRSRVLEVVASEVGARGDAPQVVVVDRVMSRDEMLAFYRSIDCYVSAHRGEGFGFPIAEALLMNKPVIATDWSAPAEYARGLFAPVDYDLEAPHSMEQQPFYLADQRWASPRLESLAARMVEASDGRLRGVRDLAAARFSALLDQAAVAARAALEAI